MSVSLRSREALIPWGIWAAMFAAALLFVARYASNVPSWDDWDMIPVLTGNQPVSWDWLWSQHNEHRVPIPRLLFLGLNRLTVVDMRVTMYFDVLIMAALAAAMMLTAARLRGKPSAADAFFPLVLLHWGQAANLLWGWQLQFFASVALACVALLAIVRAGATMPVRRSAVIVAGCALLLPLCGANGLGMAPALAVWPLALALLPETLIGGLKIHRNRTIIALGAGALVVASLYFVGWEPVPYHPKSQSIYQTLKTSVQFATIGLGPAARESWPFSGLVTLVAFGLTALLLIQVFRNRAAERARAAGLICFIAALAALALGLGLGRNGFETRYVTLAVPAWCALYFAWILYGARGARWIPAALAVVASVALWRNTEFGLAYARELKGQLGGFEQDLAAGVPSYELIRRYGSWLHPHQDIPARYLPMLKSAAVGHYSALREDPAFRANSIELHPAETRELQWNHGDSVARVSGPDPRLQFRLPSDRAVAGIRLGYQYQSDDGTLPFIAVQWKPRGHTSFSPERYYKYSPTGDRANWERGTWDRITDDETTLTIWVADSIGEISITPDFRPALFRITELTLLELVK